jgi:hypothetical protein
MRINFNNALNRRTLLRGLGGALALPLLDSMIPARAGAATKPIIRLGFVYTPNGMIPAGWLPKIEGAGFEITPTMRPLAPFRENLLVLSNLTQHTADALGDGGGDHARAGATWLTGVHPKKTEGSEIHAGISADQIAAKELGKQTQFASLELGIEEPPSRAGAIPAIAARTRTPYRGAGLPLLIPFRSARGRFLNVYSAMAKAPIPPPV